MYILFWVLFWSIVSCGLVSLLISSIEKLYQESKQSLEKSKKKQ